MTGRALYTSVLQLQSRSWTAVLLFEVAPGDAATYAIAAAALW